VQTLRTVIAGNMPVVHYLFDLEMHTFTLSQTEYLMMPATMARARVIFQQMLAEERKDSK
jgi:hypothetical protein